MMAEGLMTMAEFGQSVAVTPFTLMGAMSPVTLAGALAQQNAEALFGVVLTQLVRPGAPVMYGAFTSNVDMKSGAPAFGTPENTKANIASGQLARRYALPYRTTPGSASNAADAQGAYETLMALWGAVLGHGNLVYHAAGWQEGGLTASFEKFIIDVEMIQHMMEFLRPIEVNEAELALDALGAVPTGGHFFGEPHTLERYATAFYQPMLSNWQNYEAWQEAGGLDATARATRLWKKALEDYVEPVMDAACARRWRPTWPGARKRSGRASRETCSPGARSTPLCPAGHLPLKGGDWLSRLPSPIINVEKWAAATLLISPLRGRWPAGQRGRPSPPFPIHLQSISNSLITEKTHEIACKGRGHWRWCRRLLRAVPSGARTAGPTWCFWSATS